MALICINSSASVQTYVRSPNCPVAQCNDLDLKRMRNAAGEASSLLRALSNENRLLLVCNLLERERSVGELAEVLDLRYSTVSQLSRCCARMDLCARDAKARLSGIRSPASRREPSSKRSISASARRAVGGGSVTAAGASPPLRASPR